MLKLRNRLQKLREVVKTFDQEVGEFCKELAPILEKQQYSEFSDYEFLFEFLQTASISFVAARDLVNLSIDLASIAMGVCGIELPRRLFADMKKNHGEEHCDCEICKALDQELRYLEEEYQYEQENKDKFNLN